MTRSIRPIRIERRRIVTARTVWCRAKRDVRTAGLEAVRAELFPTAADLSAQLRGRTAFGRDLMSKEVG